mmetsp:Transcript_20374/g.50060  ORF Transcript_20374/g.50060 Transcript_20374/m.50060 type:complete len:294 (+) Transcript_20374:1-882(+)|eukprot:CAMPEP_0206231864 /NCGR_PEP_ID=MMETSP0047_2-20121206/11079_1 /ASSEMBLY_ACC=CAM_ASM_000192 /TAXON_ID=195065 /ORGANISM="Chroomonas mesostigmatica_cf, Strain CCMP1168" /LENGTH=293 /DNA_ID=CAMNT_0053655501 /DNA_START=1 /DNA_END=882 /DNA_ORIENTATION=+
MAITTSRAACACVLVLGLAGPAQAFMPSAVHVGGLGLRSSAVTSLRSGLEGGRAGSLRAAGVRMQNAVDDKTEVREYFNSEGFNRWSKIYSDSEDVNSVQKYIRSGHQETIDKVLAWVESDGSAASGQTFCDAGCGVGSLAIPLASMGAKVLASDISSAMAGEAAKRAADLKLKGSASFETADLESLSGKYDTVTCIDVLIHYPTEKMDDMVGHLAGLAQKRFIISFAPYTIFYAALKWVGSMAPGPSKATRAYLHAEEDVVRALEKRGFKIKRTEMTATNFYFSRLLEAVRE